MEPFVVGAFIGALLHRVFSEKVGSPLGGAPQRDGPLDTQKKANRMYVAETSYIEKSNKPPCNNNNNNDPPLDHNHHYHRQYNNNKRHPR